MMTIFGYDYVYLLSIYFVVSYQITCDRCESDYRAGCTTSAVVPYDEAGIPNFFKQERTFTFGRDKLVIQQDWTNLGVAGVAWDAAIVLSEYLEKEELSGLKVIELGAGTGILSIAMAKFGARVTATDLKGPLPLITRNVRTNLKGQDSERISVKELEWGKNTDLYLADYDLILGADIIYKEEVHDDLLSTLIGLSHTGSKIILSTKIRYEKDRKFLQKLSHSFKVDEIYHDINRDIYIHIAVMKSQ